MIGRAPRRRAGVVGLSAGLTLGAVVPGVAAAHLHPGSMAIGDGPGAGSRPAAGPAEVVGRWTPPFEEDGETVPRCRPAGEGDRSVTCKPAAVAAAVLGDGRAFYANGLEGQENAQGPTATSLAPSARDSQARVLDLRTGAARWTMPAPPRGGPSPAAESGPPSSDDPRAVLGVPGRPGDGFVGSTWGAAGGPAHDPASPPDDPAPNDGDLFCSDVTALPDGRLLLAGGTDWYNQPSILDRNQGDPLDVGVGELEGLRHTWLFDPGSEGFEPAGAMKYGRWCPHVAVGPDGAPTVFGGATRVVTAAQLGNVRRTETYRVGSATWEENHTGAASENHLPLRPRIVLAPNGQFLYAAVGQPWGLFGPAVDDALTAFFQFFDPDTNEWSISGLAPLGARRGAFVVPLTLEPPYDQMTLATWGGVAGPAPASWLPANPFTTLTTVDANGNVTNREAGDLHHARWSSSGVLLPDGKVLAVGGLDKDDTVAPGFGLPVLTPELYDPQTTRWSEVAPLRRARGHHHTALLLPDMRVLVGGNVPLASGYGGANRDVGGPFANNDRDPSFEVWSPPYLFRGPRPTIERVQKGVAHGETFTITTPDAALVESVLLMRTPSPGQGNDSDQRSLRLEFTRSGPDTLTATAPPSGDVAPPGAYYLVVNRRSLQGPVPSVAHIVGVGRTDPSDAPRPFPADPPPPEGSATPDEDTSGGAVARPPSRDVLGPVPKPTAAPVPRRRWLLAVR